MKTLILAIGILSLIDLLVVPMLLSVIRKSGGFHYLISTLHKLVFTALVFVAGVVLIRNGDHNVVFQVAFCLSFLFLFNQTFEINDYLFRLFDGSKYSLDGMNDAGKETMTKVFEDMEKNNSKPFVVRFGEMVKNFTTNISQDFTVISMVATNDTPMKEAFDEMHKLLGNDIKFAKMTKTDLFFMVKKRVLIDGVVLVLVGLVLFV